MTLYTGFDVEERYVLSWFSQYGISRSVPIESPASFLERCGILSMVYPTERL